jgi:hypothetical protein
MQRAWLGGSQRQRCAADSGKLVEYPPPSPPPQPPSLSSPPPLSLLPHLSLPFPPTAPCLCRSSSSLTCPCPFLRSKMQKNTRRGDIPQCRPLETLYREGKRKRNKTTFQRLRDLGKGNALAPPSLAHARLTLPFLVLLVFLVLPRVVGAPGEARGPLRIQLRPVLLFEGGGGGERKEESD